MNNKIDLNSVLNKNLTSKQKKKLNNEKKKAIKGLKNNTKLSKINLDSLLSPLDLTDPKSQYFLSQIKGIQYEELATLTNKTGLQLKYTALIPSIIKNIKKENIKIKKKDINKIKNVSKKLSNEMTIRPNYLITFLNKLATKLENYRKNMNNNIKENLKNNPNKNKCDILDYIKNNSYKIICILLILYILLLFIFINRNKEILMNIVT